MSIMYDEADGITIGRPHVAGGVPGSDAAHTTPTGGRHPRLLPAGEQYCQWTAGRHAVYRAAPGKILRHVGEFLDEPAIALGFVFSAKTWKLIGQKQPIFYDFTFKSFSIHLETLEH